MQKGGAYMTCVHTWRSFYEQQKISYVTKVPQCSLLSSILRDILGKIQGENEC